MPFCRLISCTAKMLPTFANAAWRDPTLRAGIQLSLGGSREQLSALKSSLTSTQKYDVLSCGMGALACTSFFVYNGQDPGTALSITLMATISGLVSLKPLSHCLSSKCNVPCSFEMHIACPHSGAFSMCAGVM